MYVRMYVCMYVCMHVCMYVCMYACMHVYIYIYIYSNDMLHVFIPALSSPLLIRRSVPPRLPSPRRASPCQNHVA